MTPRQIKIELRERNILQKDLAEELGVSDVSISRTINKKNVSRRLMLAISDRIDTPIKKVFPEYFDLEDPDELDQEAA